MTVSQGYKTLVQYQNVSKIYQSGDESIKALGDINLSIEDGEFVSFVGPSGCGKTTLLHLTAGLIDATEGEILLGGVDVQTDELNKHEVGLVFQEPVLFEWRTVLGNIMLPVKIMSQNNVLDNDLDYYKERAKELIGLVGLDGFEESYPKELSGGMQQRASICRSLVYNPSILLMDEPFGALDAFTRDQLNLELLRIWQETNKTILFVTHNLEEAAFLSDRVIVFSSRPGEIIDTIDIDIPRPRDDETRMSDTFHDYVAELYTHFRDVE